MNDNLEEERKILEELDDKKALQELEKGYPKAEKLLEDKEKAEEFLQRLEMKLKKIPKVGETLAIVPIMISLVRSYLNKEYTKIPLGTIIAITSALAYVLTPVDLITDAIPIIGYIDDALIIEACLKLVKSDVDEYQEWRENKNKVKTIDETKK